MHDVIKLGLGKIVHHRLRDFNVSKYTDRFQIPHCNQPSRNCYLSSLSIVSKKNTHNFLKKLLKYSTLQFCICVRLNFSHVFQPKQHISTDGVLKQVREISYFLGQILKKFARLWNNVTLLLNFCLEKYSYFNIICYHVIKYLAINVMK